MDMLPVGMGTPDTKCSMLRFRLCHPPYQYAAVANAISAIVLIVTLLRAESPAVTPAARPPCYPRHGVRAPRSAAASRPGHRECNSLQSAAPPPARNYTFS